MANKHLSEDEIQYTVDVKTAKAQQEIHKLETQSAALRSENKQRLQQMIKLEASGKKESEQYKKLAATYKDTGKQIRDLTYRIQEQTHKLDTNAMTMSQLRKQSKSLQKELDNVSKTLNPKQYDALESRLQSVNARMAELKQNAKGFKELLASDEYNNFFLGQIAVKGIDMAIGWVKSLTGTLSEAVTESIDLAESADGISHAFEKIGTQDYLEKLRQATKGTVSDVELMKAAVKAKDFGIPLEDLGKYLSFAQLKAQQTGQSLDYMVDSIVTGLGRQSLQILDNLGLSATEIRDKTKETGDFVKGVAAIVEKNLATAGETYISAADRAAQRTVELENAQLALGKSLLPVKEEFTDLYGQIQLGAVKVLKYMAEHWEAIKVLLKAVGLLTVTYMAYVAGQKLAYLWGLREVAVKKLKAAATAVENTLLELSVLRHAALNKTMKTSIALQKAFNVVLKLSPWGLALGGITLVVGALLMFNRRTDAATVAQKKLNSIQEEAKRKTEEERIKIEILTRRIHDNSLSINERRDAISALQKIVPDYTAKLSKEGKVYDENTEALTRYLNALKEKALLEGAQEAIKDLGRKKADLMVKKDQQQKQLDNIKKEQGQFTQKSAGQIHTSGGAVAPGYVNATSGYSANVSALSKQLQKTADQIKLVDTTLDAITKEFSGKLLKSEKTIGSGIGGGGGKSGSDKSQLDPDDIVTKKFSADRQSDIDSAKTAYQQDLNNLNMALAKKKISHEQYNVYVSALNTQNATNLLAIEQSYQEQSQQIAIKDADKKKKLQEDQDKRVEDAKQKLVDTQIEAEKSYQAVMAQLTNEGKAAHTLSLEQERDAKLAVLDGYYKNAKLLAEQSGEDITNVETAYQTARQNIINDYADKELKRIRELEAQKAQARQEYDLDTFEDQYAAQSAKRKADYDKGLIDKQQYDQAMANLDREAEDHKLQIRQQYGLASQQELYNAEMEQLKQHLQNKEISEEEYEEAVKNLKISKMKEAFDYYANLSNGAVQALQQAEEANVDAKYDAEIEAARNAGKDTSEIEKKKANEKLKIQKKYADVNFAIKASQIIADTATSIMKAYADLGPIAGSVAAALMGVTGVAQLAAANAERQRVKKMSLCGAGSSGSAGARVATGLESGGSIDIKREQDGKLFHAVNDPGKRGYVDNPTVIVGEGGYGHSREWVASNAAVENPTVAPFIDIIDRAQRAGTIRTLDMGKFLIQQAQGRASGGTVAPTVNNIHSIARDSYKDTLIERLTNVLDRIADDGIPASVALDDIERKQQLRDKSRKFGSK